MPIAAVAVGEEQPDERVCVTEICATPAEKTEKEMLLVPCPESILPLEIDQSKRDSASGATRAERLDDRARA